MSIQRLQEIQTVQLSEKTRRRRKVKIMHADKNLRKNEYNALASTEVPIDK